MRSLFIAIAISILSFGPARADGHDTGIEQTITAQLQAFTARDVAQAFTFASPMIQGMFGTSDTFGTMVERGYPMVWNNADVQFGDTQQVGDMVLQRVYIRDTTGTLHALEYAMINGPDGWRINGVQLLPSPEVGA